MARIIDSNSNHFADGWQNKKASEKVSENVRESGQKHVEANKTVANKMLEGVAKNMDASHTTAASTQHSTTASTPVERQVAHQSQAQAARPEVQTEGAVQQAREQFQKLKGEAKNLENLISSRSDTRTSQTATSNAVSNAPSATQTNLQQNAQSASTFSVSQTMNRVPQQGRTQAEAATRNVDPRRLAPEDQTRVRQGSENAEMQDVSRQGATPEAVNAAPMAPQADLRRNGEGTAREERSDSKVSQKRTGTQSSKTAGSQRAPGSNTDEMSRLMGGESSFSSGEGDEPSTEITAAETQAASSLPETDGMLVFSEIDTNNPGIETVLAKRNILERHVIKSVVDRRVAEIAKLDQSVEGLIQDRFATGPLSQRIVGDLQGEIRTADFLRGLYGGGLSA